MAYAQPRGSYSHGGGGYARPGNVAPYRHPRAGTGSYYHGGYYGGHYHGGYYGGYYPYYPYYGGYYYRPYVYGSVYLGWPYYSSSWPYYSGGYYAGGDYTTSYTYAPSYYGEEPPPADPYANQQDAPATPYRDEGMTSAPPSGGQVRLEVRPDDASVYVDDQYRGSARDARMLSLPAGPHTIELVRPGFATEHREIEVVKGQRVDLLVELRRP